jgi:hypothetical protein
VPGDAVPVDALGTWGGCGVVEAGAGEPMPKPGTDIPLEERLLMADWLR